MFWVDSSTKQTIEQGFSKIAQSCKIADDLPSIRTWLSNVPKPWLLIFDNADDPSIDISHYFPVGPRGTILITTRNPDCKVHQTVGSYEFAGMAVDDAVDLLLKTTGTDDLSSQGSRLIARNIVTTLGNLALAIIQAGVAIRQNICRIEDYCDIYRRRRQELLSRAPIQASSDYKYTIYTAWEVSVNMIERMSTEVASHALELLRLFSFFHFDVISEEIFSRAWRNKTRRPRSDWKTSYEVNWLCRDDLEWDPYHVREAVALLSSFSLIRVDGLTNNVSMHPLVHAWARDRLGIAEKKKWSLATALILAASIPWGKKTSDYSFRRSLISHVTTSIISLKPENLFVIGVGEKELLEVATKFISVFADTGQWQETVGLEEKVLEAMKRMLGDEHPNTLVSMGNLARSYSDLGRRQEAMELEEKVLEASKRTLGDEHLNTLMAISNLARSYSDLGRQQEAMNLEEKVLEAMKRMLGDEHPDTLVSMNNLARSYSGLGRQQEAMELGEEVLKARKRMLGDEHPKTLLSMNNLAASYSYLGRQQEAMELGEEVLKARKRMLGDEHPKTLLSINNLAISYSDLGRQQEARELGEEALKARKRTLGEEHPDTLVSMENLMFFLADLHQQNNPQNLVLRPALQPAQKIKGNTRSRWSLRSWGKKKGSNE